MTERRDLTTSLDRKKRLTVHARVLSPEGTDDHSGKRKGGEGQEPQTRVNLIDIVVQP